VFTCSGNTWSQQSPKLIGSGATASSRQGASVALSGDGNTALVGAPQDNSGVGAIWGFFRDSGVWVEPLSKFIGTGAAGGANQGASIALSADGNTAIVGGPQDTQESERRGSLGATAVHGRRWARSWSAAGLREARSKELLSVSPPTAVPPSSEGPRTLRHWSGVGFRANCRGLGSTGPEAGGSRRSRNALSCVVSRPLQGRQYSHRGRSQ
jgi:hypothetical protein